MGASRVDQDTGEVLEQGAAPQSGVDYSAMLVQAMSRSERLLARQDSLLDENKLLRQELGRQRKLYSEAKAEFHAKLAEAQAEFDIMQRDNNVSYTSKKNNSRVTTDTASMEAAMKAVGDSLTKRGVSVRQPVVDHSTDRNMAIVRTILSCNGYEESHDISIRSAYSYSSNGADVKTFGAEVSLVRKYGLFAALGLVQETKDKDDSHSARRDYSSRSTQGYRGEGSYEPQGQSGAQQAQQPDVSDSRSAGSFSAAQVQQMFTAATTVQELSKTMNSIPMDVRKEIGAQALFNERRMQLQGQRMAA